MAGDRTYVFVRMFSAPFALLNYAILGYVLGRGRGGRALLLQLLLNGINIALSILLRPDARLGHCRRRPGHGLRRGRRLPSSGFVVVLGVLPTASGRASADPRPGTASCGCSRVNRDIMIRSFCLLGGFALFTRLGAQFGTLTLAANGILMNLFMVGSYFLDGFATAAEQTGGRAVGARHRPAFDRAVAPDHLWGCRHRAGALGRHRFRRRRR